MNPVFHDHFDVAVMLGHQAFAHLSMACSLYAPITQYLDPSLHSWQSCLGIGSRISTVRKDEMRNCISAVVLFQAMMEKVLNFVPAFSGQAPVHGSFAVSWGTLINGISDPAKQAEARAAFEKYDEDFYKAFRTPIIHGRRPSDVTAANAIRFSRVYLGMQSGWAAYDCVLEQTFPGHQSSWSVACEAHNLPTSVTPETYPDLGALEVAYLRRHEDGANRLL